ncbi:unnamed protein product, partial [Closterium sp. NIES-65]
MSFAPVGFAKVRGIVKTSLGRILTVTWFALMIVVSSSYIAALTAALVLQKLQLPVSSIYDAAGSDVIVGYQYGSFVYGYLVQLGFSPSRLVPLNNEQDYYEALSSCRPLHFSHSALVSSLLPLLLSCPAPLPQSRLVPLNGEQEYYKALTSFFPPFSPSNLPHPQSCLMPLNSEQDYYKALTSFFPPFSLSHIPLPQSRLVPLNSEQDYYEALSSQRVAIRMGEDPLPQRLPLSLAPPTLPPTLIPHPQSRLVPLNSEQDYYEALTSQRVALIVDEDPYLNVFASQYCQVLRASQAFNVLNSAFVSPWGDLGAPRDS